MADPAPTEDPDLALPAPGTRFALSATEERFREWSFVRAQRNTAARLREAAVLWLVMLGLAGAVRADGYAPWAVGIGLMLGAIAAAQMWLRAGLRVRVELALLASFGLSGVLGVGLSNVHLDSPATGVAATVWTCFFQFRTSLLRPAHLALAVATYVVLELGFIARDASSGVVAPELVAVWTFLVVSAFAIGVLGAVSGTAGRRRSYRQTCIIERQAEIIARERARSEALLKQELAHQVAERSRELGAVLAKSDVTLDVRRLSPGERFDARYRIVAALGAGGMGAVYEVERLTDGATLALKAVVGEVSGASAARFAREAEIGARVHHPNLVSIVDVGVSAGVPFLVMELVRGGSLESQRARFGDVPWALPILRQIAEGLAALHDAGVVHRDLKPANVLLTGEGAATIAKISDFGISRFGALDDAASSIDPNAATVGPSSPRPSALTGTGMVMGTPLYMAPEAARGGRNVDAPADVFALGIIAYEMLTGRAPFSVPAVMLAIAGQPVPAAPPIDEARVPAPLRALVLDCLDGDPAKRPRVRAVVAGIA